MHMPNFILVVFGLTFTHKKNLKTRQLYTSNFAPSRKNAAPVAPSNHVV